MKVVHVSPHVSRDEPEKGEAKAKTPRKAGAFATLMRRHNAAAERQIPACAAFGQCGGCTLQHLDDAAQLRFKREVVVNALAPLVAPLQAGPEASAEVVVAPCVASPQPLFYRSRVKLVAAYAPTDPSNPAAAPARVILGAYAPRSHRVIDLAGCKVNTLALRAVARTLAEAWSASGLTVYDETTGSGALRYVLLREVRSGAMQVSLVVATAPARESLLAVIATLRAAHPLLASVVLHHNPHSGNALLVPTDRTDGALSADSELGTAADELLFGPLFLAEELGQTAGELLPFRVSARSFLQVNRAVASRLYSDVAAALPVAAGQTILDLYCGIGGLGRTVLAKAPGARLIGIEASASAVADAEHSARAAGLSPEQARFLCGAVEELLPELLASGTAGSAPVVLLNPPRRGCTKGVLDAVLNSAPHRIAYVSCNPQSLARDLTTLAAAGYRVTGVTPYDMHPGTPHIETLALLAR